MGYPALTASFLKDYTMYPELHRSIFVNDNHVADSPYWGKQKALTGMMRAFLSRSLKRLLVFYSRARSGTCMYEIIDLGHSGFKATANGSGVACAVLEPVYIECKVACK